MGIHYHVPITCVCGYQDTAYCAPTCGFVSWKCPKCKLVFQLEKEIKLAQKKQKRKSEVNA